MPEQLKIIIDADVNKAIAGVKNLSNVIAGDFVTATETANAAIGVTKKSIESLSGKNLKLDINSADAVQKITALEKSLLNLEALKVSPGISSTQLQLFEANIQKVKAEIASLKTQALVIPIGVDVTKAQASVTTLSESIETLRAKAEAKKIFITTETDITKIAAYNKEIQSLEARVRQLQNVGKKGFELFVVPNQAINSVKNLTAQVAAFGGGVKTFIPPAIAGFNKLPSSIAPVITQLKALGAQSAASGAAMSSSFSKAFQGLKSLANIIPGIGLGGLIGLAATAVNALTEGFFEAAFGASKLDKALDGAAGSIDKEAGSIFTMVGALQSGTLSSSEFKKIKAELIAQSPEFQKSFDGDKIKIDASNAALVEYAKQLVTTTKVTAALTIVNDVLAKSIATIAKGGAETGIQKFFSGVLGIINPVAGAISETGNSVNNLSEAFNNLKPENVQKLLEDTFKSLGISFKDFTGTIDDKALKDRLAKIKAEFEKFQTETISKAKQFVKEFGESFVLPKIAFFEESFFVGKDEIFKRAKKLLGDVAKNNLKIKFPVLPEFEFLPTETKLTEAQLQELTKGFFEGIRLEKNIPLDVTFDPTLAPGTIDKINKKLDLRGQFSILGDLGLKEFDKIDFSNMNAGIAEATKRLEGMMAIATTLNQTIGQGLSSAFNAVFDSILEGKSVFKALGEAIKQLVVGTIKAIAQMLILKAITNLIFPGGGAAAGGIGKLIGGAFGGQANIGFGAIGSSPFSNVIQIVGTSSVTGDQIRTVYSRSQTSSGRFG